MTETVVDQLDWIVAVRAVEAKHPLCDTQLAAQPLASVAAIDSVAKETRTPPTVRAPAKYLPSAHGLFLSR